MYAIRVYFFNNDWFYDWYKDYILEELPDKEWINSLYDGVNEVLDYKIIGRVVKYE